MASQPEIGKAWRNFCVKINNLNYDAGFWTLKICFSGLIILCVNALPDCLSDWWSWDWRHCCCYCCCWHCCSHWRQHWRPFDESNFSAGWIITLVLHEIFVSINNQAIWRVPPTMRMKVRKLKLLKPRLPAPFGHPVERCGNPMYPLSKKLTTLLNSTFLWLLYWGTYTLCCRPESACEFVMLDMKLPTKYSSFLSNSWIVSGFKAKHCTTHNTGTITFDIVWCDLHTGPCSDTLSSQMCCPCLVVSLLWNQGYWRCSSLHCRPWMHKWL